MFVQAGVPCQWTADSQRLILEYFDMICDSPSHIYSSALLFFPSSSWLHRYCGAELSQEIKVIKEISEWGKCSRMAQLDCVPQALAWWKDTIAVGLKTNSIIILDVITGSQMAVFSGHTGWVISLTFSPDGTSLVSGSCDKTIKLWDLQTGGVAKTFQGHMGYVYSVSVSVDCTTIASGSSDKTICLWDIQTGVCHCVIQQEYSVMSVYFFPLDPQHLISISGGKIWEWDIDGHQITPAYDGSCATFSLDGTKFVLCNGAVVQVQSSDSRATVTEFHIANHHPRCCCFSPDGRLIAIAAGYITYVWDIANPDPDLIETFTGHAGIIASLVFSSPTSLVSASWDKSVKFWQIGASSTALDMANQKSTPITSPIKSITLQAKDKIAISSDLDGMIRVWDLLTGACKATFQTLAQGSCLRDVQLVANRLIFAWHTNKKIHILDAENGEILQMLDIPEGSVKDLRISGDGSIVFCLYERFIQAWYIWTGEVIGKLELEYRIEDPILTIDGSRVWIHPWWGDTEGWDFGVPNLSSIQYYSEPPNRPHLDFIGGIRKRRSFLPGIEDTITGKEIFRLPEKHARPTDAQWDGQYLVAGYDSGEVLILDCSCTLPH